MRDDPSQNPPEEYQHNTDRSAGIQRGGQDICAGPEISICNSGNDEMLKRTVVFGPEGETSSPDQILKYKPDHSPRNVIQGGCGWDEADATEQYSK